MDVSASTDEIIRTMIQRENDLINNRVNWLTTVQALLFAGFSIMWDKPGPRSLSVLFCVLGICISLISLGALVGATAAMTKLQEWWDDHKPDDYKGPDVIGLRPPQSRILHYLAPWNLIPVLFLVAWIAVWFTR